MRLKMTKKQIILSLSMFFILLVVPFLLNIKTDEKLFVPVEASNQTQTYDVEKALADKIFEHGKKYLISGQYRKAIVSWGFNLATYPDHTLSMINLKKAKEELEWLANEQWLLGLQHFESMRYQEALDSWLKAKNTLSYGDGILYKKIDEHIKLVEQKLREGVW